MIRQLLFVLVAISAGAAVADELPRRKSGLWTMSVTMPGGEVPLTMQQCIDEKRTNATAAMADKTRQSCKSQTKREGSRLVFDSTCKLGKSTSTTRGVFVGDFKSSYTYESTTTFNPPMPGMREGVTKGAAQWAGPCSAGMRAGDVVMSNGMKFNVNDAPAKKK